MLMLKVDGCVVNTLSSNLYVLDGDRPKSDLWSPLTTSMHVRESFVGWCAYAKLGNDMSLRNDATGKRLDLPISAATDNWPASHSCRGPAAACGAGPCIVLGPDQRMHLGLTLPLEKEGGGLERVCCTAQRAVITLIPLPLPE